MRRRISHKVMSCGLLVVVFGLFAGCSSLGPLFQGPTAQEMNGGMAPKFYMYSEAEDLSRPWWQALGSPALDSLMDRAVRDGFSVRLAAARLRQARLLARIAGAAEWPSLDYQAGVNDRINEDDLRGRSEEADWSAGLSASYEVDLWGRIRAQKSKAILEAEASEDDLHSALITITAELAGKWISLISNLRQQRLFREELDLQRRLLGIVKARFPIGLSTALDIYQQQQAIEKIVEAQIPLEERERALKRQIAFLAGVGGPSQLQGVFQEMEQDFPQIDGPPKPGLPADLLASRPDIRGAGRRLRAEGWAVAAAKADRLPALRLSASHTFSAAEISNVLDNWILNLGANLAGPIFDGGRRSLEVKRTQAVVRERLESYRQVVFQAILEVNSALGDEEQNIKVLASLEEQFELAEKTLREARNRYLNGSSDFLNVLKEELNSLLIRQKLITTKEKRLIARINLYRALGGAWVEDVK